jgi:hypothetical protein
LNNLKYLSLFLPYVPHDLLQEVEQSRRHLEEHIYS